MIEHDLQKLALRDQSQLPNLEADIWRRESELVASRKSGRRIASWQAGVLAVAVISAASFGAIEASAFRVSGTSLTQSDLAPASLILGSRE